MRGARSDVGRMEEVLKQCDYLLQASERSQRAGWVGFLRGRAQRAHEDLGQVGDDARATLDSNVCNLVHGILWRDVVEVGGCSVSHADVEDPWRP